MRKGFLGVWMGLFIWSCSEEADLPTPYSPYPNIDQYLTINPELTTDVRFSDPFR